MATTPIVETSDGALKGVEATNATGRKYFKFLGIPYAKPPLADLRFKAPLPPDKWIGVRNAFEEGPVPPQIDSVTNTFQGNEDCLYLNVFTPELPGKGIIGKPVMFWIYGGAFILGSSKSDLYGPDYFLDEGVVLVSFNYRLGALGFLNTEDDALTPNCGLRDQVAALKWVNNNIYAFGGDPKNITIFGQSAGAVSAQYMMLSPLCKGLFQKVIAESGSTLIGRIKHPRDIAFQVGENLGIKTTDSKELVNYMKMLTAKQIVIMQSEKLSSGKRYYGPSVEVKSTPDILIPDDPLKLLESGKFYKVPLLMGTNSAEGILNLSVIQQNPNFLEEANNDPTMLIPSSVELIPNEEQAFGKKLKDFYFGEKAVSTETTYIYVDLLTDANFSYGSNKTAKICASLSNIPIFYYLFNYDGKLGYLKPLFKDVAKGVKGPCHADELGYLFYTKGISDISPDEPEAKVRSIMVKLWTNFAKFGNPTPESKSPIKEIWKSFSFIRGEYLKIDLEPTLQTSLTPERLAFWEEFHITHPYL